MEGENIIEDTSYSKLPQKIEVEPKQLIPLKRKVRIATRKGKEVIAVTKEKTKLELFLEEYVRNNGNGTEAALKVFDTTSRLNAANLAHQYLKKAQSANRLLLEKKGYTQGKMIEEAITKMKVSKTPEWWDRLMKMAGYEDFMSKGPVTKQTVNIMKVQKDLLDEYVDGEYTEEVEE